MLEALTSYEDNAVDPIVSLDTILLPNPCEEDCAITEPHIIIFADVGTDRVYAMNMSIDCKPRKFSYQTLLKQLESRVMIKGEFKPPEYMLVSDHQIKQKQLEKRSNKMLIIQPILKNIEEFLVSNSYGKSLIKRALKNAKANGIKTLQRTEIYSVLYRYWRGGSRANAFLRKPGSGISTNKTYQKKTGPKRVGTRFQGHMLNDTDKRYIKSTINKYVEDDTPLSLLEAFDRCKDHYYSDPLFNSITGEINEYDHWVDDRAISLNQFLYHANQYLIQRKPEVREKQRKTDKYAKDISGLKGNVKEIYAEGPGSVYQIDETPLAIELVSELDKDRMIRVGKPTAYSVTDMFSNCVAGILLTINNSSAHTASEIMYIAFRNKKDFCKEIGVSLHNPWLPEGKCKVVFVDNAEFASELTRSFSREAQVTVNFNTEGQSHQKGAVERSHKTLEDFLFGLVPGASKKKIDDYLKTKLRKDALINRRELYQIIIDYITTRSEFYPLNNIVLTKEMRRDKVARIPNRVWEWGLTNRAGHLRKVDDTELQIELLEEGEVTVHRDHLYLRGKFIRNSSMQNPKGLKYLCDWTLLNALQDVRKGRELPRLRCRFKRYSMNKILIETQNGQKIATLHPDEKSYENMSAEEITNDKLSLSAEERQQKSTHSSKQSRTRINTDNTVSEARKEQVPITKRQANIQNISENRQEAKDHENHEVSMRHQNALNEHSGAAANEVPQSLVKTETPDDKSTEPTDETTSVFRQLRKRRKSKK